jgi:hypothetical protein
MSNVEENADWMQWLVALHLYEQGEEDTLAALAATKDADEVPKALLTMLGTIVWRRFAPQKKGRKAAAYNDSPAFSRAIAYEYFAELDHARSDKKIGRFGYKYARQCSASENAADAVANYLRVTRSAVLRAKTAWPRAKIRALRMP